MNYFKLYQDLPISTDPAISNTVARQHACLIVSTFDPTLVPNELATSLAPIPNAKTKAITNPKMIIHKMLGEYGSNIVGTMGETLTMASS